MTKKFHVTVPKGALERLEDGQVLPVTIREGIYGYITPEERCPNFKKGGRGYLLNLYCPDEDDFEIHETTKRDVIVIR